ncbi:MAG: hypothetical protein J6A59_09210 [Lachnospiraceae bacterium]|nr:hypothetical protein [Lachnospiraceae bacterium]
MKYKYNTNAQYEIIGRVVDGVQVISYILRDRNSGKHLIMNKSDVDQHAINKNIYNCIGQWYNNKILIKGINCKLNQLDKFDKNGNRIEKVEAKSKCKVVPTILIVGRVIDGRNIVSYVLKYKDGNSLKTATVDKETVVKLASEGKIINVTTQKLGDKIILRSTQEHSQLSKLPLYKA